MSLKNYLLMALRPWLWSKKVLSGPAVAEDPLKLFHDWYRDAQCCWWIEFANAMSLSTIGDDGYPQSRMVLLKSYDESGFVFFTNFNSRKGRNILAHGKVSLLFYWEPLHRQIRIVGDVEPVPEREADAYFATRPRVSQLGAWASKQSEPLERREILEQRVREYSEKYKDAPIPRPPYWSGFRVKPRTIEFWVMRASRLHDRILYSREGENWRAQRLYP